MSESSQLGEGRRPRGALKSWVVRSVKRSVRWRPAHRLALELVVRTLPARPTYFESLLADPSHPKWSYRTRAIANLVGPFPDTVVRVLRNRASRRSSMLRLEDWALSTEFTGRWTESVGIREQQLAQSPSDVSVLYSLANAVQRNGTVGFRNDPIVGLTPSPVGDRERARRLLADAIELAPDSVLIQYALGRLELNAGNGKRAVEHLSLATMGTPSATWLLDLGRAYQRPEVSDFVKAAESYTRALQIEPNHSGALARLASVSVRTNDWREGWKTLASRQLSKDNTSEEMKVLIEDLERFLYESEEGQDPEDLVRRLAGLSRRGEAFERELIRQVSSRLQYLGKFELAFRVKDLIAQRVLFETRWLRRSHEHLLSRFSALAMLNRPHEILEMFQPHPWQARTELEELRFEKIKADAAFAMGDARPLARFAAEERSAHPLVGDRLMEDLITGRRVAIVGPSDLGEEHGAEIDSFDTVIRTRFSKEFVESNRVVGGVRTDISYYSSTDIGPFLDEAQAAVTKGHIRLAVTRPLAYSALSDRADVDSWLRFYRHEYCLHFLGSPLGIPRMIYDVLQFSPQEVKVFNTDLYTGNAAFAKGYRDAKDVSLTANSLLNDLFRSHDLRAEFSLFKTLRDNAVISTAGRLSSILELDPPGYLRLLERSNTFAR